LLLASDNPTNVAWSGTITYPAGFGPASLNVSANKNVPFGSQSAFADIHQPFQVNSDTVYDLNDIPLTQQLTWTFSGRTRQCFVREIDTSYPPLGGSNALGVAHRALIQSGEASLFTCPTDWPFDANYKLYQQVVRLRPHYSHVLVELYAEWRHQSIPGFIRGASYNKLLAISGGAFSDTFDLTDASGATPIVVVSGVAFSGTVTASHSPATLWPSAGEELASPIMSPKIWFPEQFEIPRRVSTSGFDWTLTKNAAATITGHTSFLAFDNNYPSKVTIESGSLPPGMTLTVGSVNAGPFNSQQIRVSGTPTTIEAGSVRFKITDTVLDPYTGAVIDTVVYKSKTYTWKVD
jgi:hypothetical protein